jgi:hypothetical protein
MAIPNGDKHKQYANYAAHCLGVAAGQPDRRDIQREMALEWLKLADALLHPPSAAGLIRSPALCLIVDNPTQ